MSSVGSTEKCIPCNLEPGILILLDRLGTVPYDFRRKPTDRGNAVLSACKADGKDVARVKDKTAKKAPQNPLILIPVGIFSGGYSYSSSISWAISYAARSSAAS